MRGLLSVEEALRAVMERVREIGEVEEVGLFEAAGRVLAEDVVAAHDLPPFDNSAADGYAVRAADTRGASRERPAVLKVVGESRAGTMPPFRVGPGEAAYVTTGAPIPEGADAVVMVERTEETGGFVKVFSEVEPGERVRRRGEDVREGEVALKEGAFLRPYEVGLLAALGVTSVKVYRRPKVSVITTGDEIVGPESELSPGKVRDSVGPMLLSALSRLGAEARHCGRAGDSVESLVGEVRRALDGRPDVLLICGGVSVGRDDLVKGALHSLGFEEVFHGVNMRPGKPLLFGKLGEVLVFGLPGNPVSAMLNFEAVVKPCLLKMMRKEWKPKTARARMAETAENPTGRPHFLRVKLERTGDGFLALPVKKHGAGTITSLTEADGFVEVPPHGTLREGEEVEVRLLE